MNRANKQSRIAGLEPQVAQGRIRLCRRHQLLLDQLRQFPLAAHDDGPDALEMAVEALEPAFRQLVTMEPVTVARLPQDIPKAGIYLLSERGRHLYVGRTNRMRARLQRHCRPSSGRNSATFAFHLARW